MCFSRNTDIVGILTLQNKANSVKAAQNNDFKKAQTSKKLDWIKLGQCERDLQDTFKIAHIISGVFSNRKNK